MLFAATYGGALYMNTSTANTTNSRLMMTNNTLENNAATADNGSGGAVVGSGLASVTFDKCLLNGNNASRGGSVYLDNTAAINLHHCTFSLCQGMHSGSAITDAGCTCLVCLTGCAVDNPTLRGT